MKHFIAIAAQIHRQRAFYGYLTYGGNAPSCWHDDCCGRRKGRRGLGKEPGATLPKGVLVFLPKG